MNFEIIKDDYFSTIAVNVDKLDTTNAPDLKSQFIHLNKEGVNNIILDLSSTKYCDSSGLSAVLVGNRTCKNSGGHFVLCGLQSNVSKLIEISQLNRVLPIAEDHKEAQQLILELRSANVS